MSADFLKINMWSFDNPDTCYTLVDLTCDEPRELITCIELAPNDENVFVYGSSNGTVRVCDTRSTFSCTSPIMTFVNKEEYSNELRAEALPSIASVKITNDGNYVITRDYLTIRIFDMRKPNIPINIIPVHPYLSQRMHELEANEAIYDRFEMSLSGDSKYVVTGSYDREFFIHDIERNVTLPLLSHRFQPKPILPTLQPIPIAQVDRSLPTRLYMKYNFREHSSSTHIDYQTRVSLTKFHPKDNVIATSVNNNLYIFFEMKCKWNYI